MNRNTPTNFRQPVAHPFRGAMIRGLAVLCPPLLTVLIIVWAITTTKIYLLEPVMGWARQGLVWSVADIHDQQPPDGRYQQIANGEYIPQLVYETVRKQPGGAMPSTGDGFYRRYVDLAYLQPHYAIPVFLAVFVLLLYFLGKFMAAGIGRFFGGQFERLVLHMPGVRAVYSAVKQVTDFVFSEHEFKATRVVAVQYPCKGIWSLGFVTGDGMAAVFDATAEPMVTVLVPYSPIPLTGGTIILRESECIDVDITFDQAFQFIVSCGVVVPPQQLRHLKADDEGKGREESQQGRAV